MNNRMTFRIEDKDRTNMTTVAEAVMTLKGIPTWRGVNQTDAIKAALQVAAEAIKAGAVAFFSWDEGLTNGEERHDA